MPLANTLTDLPRTVSQLVPDAIELIIKINYHQLFTVSGSHERAKLSSIAIAGLSPFKFIFLVENMHI